jgi:hypothetical protein
MDSNVLTDIGVVVVVVAASLHVIFTWPAAPP